MKALYLFKCWIEIATFDGDIPQHPLLVGFLQNVLLDCALTYKSAYKSHVHLIWCQVQVIKL